MKNLENFSIEETFLAMSCPATNMTSFNKSKEDFIWFIKKASTDIKSDAHAEQYHWNLAKKLGLEHPDAGLIES